MAFHEGRVRLSGGSECQGEVEIYFRQDWRRVLLDSWSLSEALVLCRQLGCGSVVNYRSSPSTTEHKHMCVMGLSCSGSEVHLDNCSSAQGNNSTSPDQTYPPCPLLHPPPPPPPPPPSQHHINILFCVFDLSKSSTHLSTGSLCVGNAALPGLSASAGTVLPEQSAQERTRRKTEPEAVYEEMNHRYMARRITSFTQRGSLLSKEWHSGYEDVDDELLS
ncbi:hypothetical protein QTP86_001948, partial [Hemibagrus guttatus]